MTELLVKGNTFEWMLRRETIFQELKKRLTRHRSSLCLTWRNHSRYTVTHPIKV
jgi:hypothetical protein